MHSLETTWYTLCN